MKMCPEILREDNCFIAICERKVGHKGKHKAIRILKKNYVTTIEWTTKEFGHAERKP